MYTIYLVSGVIKISLNKTIRVKSNLVNFLVMLFLINGFLYFLYPQDIYNINSPIRYIKYITILSVLLMVIDKTKITKIVIYITVAISLLLINITAVRSNFNLILLINHIIPLSMYYFHDGISNYIRTYRVAIKTYIIMTIFCYVEFMLFNGMFARFADTGYRVISIYVNPNNFGLVTVLLTVYILGNKKLKNKLGIISVFLNSSFLVFLSGSRNSMLILLILTTLYIMGFIINIIKKMKIKYRNLMLGSGGVLLFVLLSTFKSWVSIALQSLLLNTRSLTKTDLFSGRLKQYEAFLSNISESVIFPYQNSIAYVDNLYLHIWGTFGLLIMIFFVLLNFYLLIKTLFKKSKQHFMLLIVFLISGIAENIIYLWPIAYFYWYLVAEILKKDNAEIEGKSLNSHQNMHINTNDIITTK